MVNRVVLIGHLGKDAELRAIPSGQSVATFNLATADSWTGKDGKHTERTEWTRIVVWGKQAEALTPYLTKGKQIYVEGKLQTRKWDKDGQTHYTTEVRADRIVLLGSKGMGERPAPHRDDHVRDEAVGHEEPSIAMDVFESDIPF